jgi:hypothetical protein
MRKYPTPEPPWIRNDPLDVETTFPTSVIALFEPSDTTTNDVKPVLGDGEGAGVAVVAATTAGVALSEGCPPPHAAKVAENAAMAAKRKSVRSKAIPTSAIGMAFEVLNLAV